MHSLSQEHSEDRSEDAQSLTRSLVRCTLSLNLASAIHSLSLSRSHTKFRVFLNSSVDHFQQRCRDAPSNWRGACKHKQCCGPRRRIHNTCCRTCNRSMNHELQCATHVGNRSPPLTSTALLLPLLHRLRAVLPLLHPAAAASTWHTWQSQHRHQPTFGSHTETNDDVQRFEISV